MSLKSDLKKVLNVLEATDKPRSEIIECQNILNNIIDEMNGYTVKVATESEWGSLNNNKVYEVVDSQGTIWAFYPTEYLPDEIAINCAHIMCEKLNGEIMFDEKRKL
jgi:hypothetical protein